MSVLALAHRYAAAGWRQRWKALIVGWGVCLAGWAGVYAIPNQFESSARIYADADAVLGLLLRGIAIDSSPAGQVEVLQRTLLSKPNLEKVILRTDLDNRVSTVAERDVLVQRLARDIRITPQTRNLFTIEYRDRDPRVAREVVQTALTLFIEAASTTDRQQMDSARTFVAQQLSSYEVQLRQAERRRAEFQARYIDLLPSDALGGSSRLEAARSRLQQVQGELQDARMRRDLTQQQLDAIPARVASSEVRSGGGSGGGRLAEAERDLRELRLRFTEQHPDVVSARNAIASLRSQCGGGGGGGAVRAPAAGGVAAGPRTNPLYEALKVRLVDVDAQIASLQRQEQDGRVEVDRLDTIARGEPELQAQFLNLDRDYNVLRRNYEELLARRESIQIAGAARTSSDRVRLEIIDPPSLPSLPVSPNRQLLFTAVLIAGIGAGLVAALAFVQLDQAFYSVHDLRKLGLPVLGGISAMTLPRRTGATLSFVAGVVALFAVFGAVLAGMPGLIVRLLA
jgi:polysaccharide chain length determinant protein (PEP-CTERM system associated)